MNANSSANYDVEIIHEKQVHEKLKVFGFLSNFKTQNEQHNRVNLKWSNPKTNIIGNSLIYLFNIYFGKFYVIKSSTLQAKVFALHL